MGSKGIRLCNDQPAEGCRSAARGWEHCGAAANDKPPPHFRPLPRPPDRCLCPLASWLASTTRSTTVGEGLGRKRQWWAACGM